MPMNSSANTVRELFSTQSLFGRHTPNRNKQLARIIVHLRDQMREVYPNLAMPTQWMIQQLVDNASIERDGIVKLTKGQGKRKSSIDNTTSINTAEVGAWQADLMELLSIIHQACDVGLDKVCTFIHTERMIPLFPNHELFDEWDAFRFSQALLHYLEKDSEN